MGRPTTAPKNCTVQVRMSEAEKQKLEECARAMDRSKSDVILRGLELVYSDLHKDQG